MLDPVELSRAPLAVGLRERSAVRFFEN